MATSVKVNLALQGGGSHGAFTWGVIDRLLDEPQIAFDGISGTSAGAMNGALLSYGLATGNPRQTLENFWRRVAESARFSPFQRTPLQRSFGLWSIENSPLFIAMDIASRFFSPYDMPRMENPLRAVLDEALDCDALRTAPVKLFVTATNVRTGLPKIFTNETMSIDALLASACLPTLFRAVEIDGEKYWDGGYSGNPTLTPLVEQTDALDTILVQINPRARAEAPTSARDIINRINEISFHAPLLKELRMIAIMRDMNASSGNRWSDMRAHRILCDEIADLEASSKLNAEWSYLERLKTMGRDAATAFLDKHRDDLGMRSTIDFSPLMLEV